MKKILLSLLAVMCLSTTTFGEYLDMTLTSTSYLPDIDGHIYQNEIEYVKDLGIVKGYSDNTFKPDNLINRAEFTKIIVEALYDENDYMEYDNPNADESCFFDVDASQWYAKYVCFAKANDIVSGHPSGDFMPNSQINYVEALKIVLRAYEAKGLIGPLGSEEDSKYWYGPYSDFVYDDYVEKIDMANNADGIQASPYLALHAVVSLDEEITRAEACVIINWIELFIKYENI